MKVHFLSPRFIEPWDYRNLDGPGIGGSETSHVELAVRLAALGHEVVSYSKLPDDCAEHNWQGVEWRDLADVNMNAAGLWIVYRDLECMDRFTPSYGRKAWLICQDVDYHDWTPARANKFEWIFGLCAEHVNYLRRRHMGCANRIVQSNNGVRVNLIDSITDVPERNPKRLIYSSSPDRGLDSLLKIFRRAREQDPELELHVYYGLDNIEKLCKTGYDKAYWKSTFATVAEAKETPGVFWHGRVGQRQLYQEMLKSSLWVYPTSFEETACCVSMEMQCLGVIPITRPYWGLASNVGHGILIEGDPRTSAMVRARYVDAIVRVANNQAGQTRVREEMISEARKRCDWQRVAEQWHVLIAHDTIMHDYLRFQRDNCVGTVLNVGCGGDMGKLKATVGAFNVDVKEIDPVSGIHNVVDQIADARNLPFANGSFDTVVLGEILEHLDAMGVIKAISEAYRVAKKRIVVTIPCDERSVAEQREERLRINLAMGIPLSNIETLEYIPGCSTYHRPLDPDVVKDLLGSSTRVQRLGSGGCGLVLEKEACC